jgi:hypothetical protein
MFLVAGLSSLATHLHNRITSTRRHLWTPRVISRGLSSADLSESEVELGGCDVVEQEQEETAVQH